MQIHDTYSMWKIKGLLVFLLVGLVICSNYDSEDTFSAKKENIFTHERKDFTGSIDIECAPLLGALGVARLRLYNKVFKSRRYTWVLI